MKSIIRNADWIIDIGEGAGVHGGKIVAKGILEDIVSNNSSLTGIFLRGDQVVSHKLSRRKSNEWLILHGAKENNLKNIKASFPLGCMTTVSGVSGSGKSTLVNEILFKALSNYFYSSKEKSRSYR